METNENDVLNNGGVVKSDNTDGNPWHNKVDGTFASPNDTSVSWLKKKTKKENDETPQQSDVSHSDFESLKKTLEESKVESTDNNKEMPSWLKQKNKSETETTESDEAQKKQKQKEHDVILNSGIFDDEKVANLSSEETSLLIDAYKKLQQKESEQIKELKKFDTGAFTGLWKEPVKPSDYLNLQYSNFESKKKYFENVYTGADKEEKLAQLAAFKQAGEKYKAEKEKSDEKYKQYQDMLDKYENPNNAYSQKRKDNAIWFNSGDSYVNYSNAKKYFGELTESHWQNLKSKDPEAYKAVVAYTGSYSSINSPLRSTDYPHKQYTAQAYEKKSSFVTGVNSVTRALKHTYDKDVWVQRGVSQLRVGNIGGMGKLINSGSSEQDLQKLVGTTFKDQGFLSCGTGKSTGGGFANNPINLNIYCPSGIEMAYIAQHSHYSSENEMIIQRGYNYKITKFEKKMGKIYLDVEAVLGSNEDMYNDDQLAQLASKYF